MPLLDTLLAKVVGTQNERELKRLRPIIGQVNAFEPTIQALSDEQLRAKTVEFRQRFVVKGYVVQVLGPDARFFETVGNGIDGESRVMLFARETLFLGCGDNVSIHQQRRSAIVIKRRDAQNGCHAGKIIRPIWPVGNRNGWGARTVRQRNL